MQRCFSAFAEKVHNISLKGSVLKTGAAVALDEWFEWDRPGEKRISAYIVGVLSA